jgi:3-oxoacyl-[acyl-carrier protein] reductase
MKLLEGKMAIVTGASRGIGRAICHSFADAGADVLLIATTEANLLRTQAEIKAKHPNAWIEIFTHDVALAETAERALEITRKRSSRVDILVNCAGIITRTLIEQLPFEEWQRVLDVNLNGTFRMCQKVLPLMREQSAGKIINLSSQMAHLPHPSAAPSYEVSKAGLVALTRHLAYQYARFGICVNAIAPGSIDTDMPKSMTPEARERLKSGVPMKRLGEPEEVGQLAVFLASSHSDYITGATLDITGGSYMS